MLVKVNAMSVCQIDIDSDEAFRLLCKTLHMDFVLDEKTDYFVREDSENNKSVYIVKNGQDELYDDRGDMFVSLRNLAVAMFPNLSFRSKEYIYNR